MAEKYLDKAYQLEGAEQTRALYDAWAQSYDEEVGEEGYATPRRVAQALRGVAPGAAAILDFGCGTGLSGLALRAEGFEIVDGVDLSAEMLERARETGAYRDLTQVAPDAELDIAPGTYDAIAAIGSIGVGAAPLETFGHLMHALDSGGLLAFSFNDHALADPSYQAAVNEWVDCGAARLLFCEHGDHLPGRNINSTVYVLEKA